MRNIIYIIISQYIIKQCTFFLLGKQIYTKNIIAENFINTNRFFNYNFISLGVFNQLVHHAS